MDIIRRIIEFIRSLFVVEKSPQVLEIELEAKAKANPEKLDWRNSVVDLMKLVGMDSSLDSRKRLAKQYGYPGNADGSAAMNIWLQKQIMYKLRR